MCVCVNKVFTCTNDWRKHNLYTCMYDASVLLYVCGCIKLLYDYNAIPVCCMYDATVFYCMYVVV